VGESPGIVHSVTIEDAYPGRAAGPPQLVLGIASAITSSSQDPQFEAARTTQADRRYDHHPRACGTLFNNEGNEGIQLFVPNLQQITVTGQAADRYGSPALPISSLMQFSPANASGAAYTYGASSRSADRLRPLVQDETGGVSWKQNRR